MELHFDNLVVDRFVILGRPHLDFALPLCATGAQGNTSYVQQLDPFGYVTGFCPILLHGNSVCRLPAPFQSVLPGDLAIHVFLSPDGEPFVGTQPKLKEIVRLHLETMEARLPLSRLAMADFCGDDSELARAASDAQKNMPIEWLVQAVLLPRLYRNIAREVFERQPWFNLDLVMGKIRLWRENASPNLWIGLPDILSGFTQSINEDGISTLIRVLDKYGISIKFQRLIDNTLSTSQIEKLKESLQRGFPDFLRLSMFLKEMMGRDLSKYGTDKDPCARIISRLIHAAMEEGWIKDLIVSARDRRPGLLDLDEIARDVGIIPKERDAPANQFVLVGGKMNPAGPALVAEMMVELQNAVVDVRMSAADALGRIASTDGPAVSALIIALKDTHADVRMTAARALGRIGAGNAAAYSALLSALDDDQSNVRKAAAEALGRVRDSRKA